MQATDGKSTNEQWSTNKSYGKRKRYKDTESGDNASGENYSAQSQNSRSTSVSATQGKTTSNSLITSKFYCNDVSDSRSKNFSVNEQIDNESKSAIEWLDYIDKVLIPRIDHGCGKGIFLCCGYLFAAKQTSLYRLVNTAIFLYSSAIGNRAALRDENLEEFLSAGLSRHKKKFFLLWQLLISK